MTNDNTEAAAAAIVEGRRATANLAELYGRLASLFARSEPFVQAGKYMGALLGDVPRKNGWQIAVRHEVAWVEWNSLEEVRLMSKV